MSQDRDGMTIKGRYILHSTARRDWVCGECGSALTTRFFEDAPHWQTVCMTSAEHPMDNFVHQSTWAYLQDRRRMDAMTAEEIFAHLPPELQAAIQAAQ